MVKAASPVRLQRDLMDRASLAGERHHRSTAEQIEYWAELGRQVAGVLDPDVLLDVLSGVAELQVVATAAMPLDPEAVFTKLENDRRSGQLAKRVSHAPVRYQRSATHPGLLDQIQANGTHTPGRFENGEFIALQGH